MKSIDFKSFIIGILSTTSFLLLVNSDSKMNEMKNLTVEQLTITKGLQIVNENDEKAVSIYSKAGGGVLKMYNKYGKNTAYLGTGGGDKGGFKIYNKNGDDIAFISATKSNKGFIQIYNSDNKSVAKLSADENDSGLLTLKDKNDAIIFESNNIEQKGSSINMSGDDLYLGNLKVKSLSVIDENDFVKGSFFVNEDENAQINLSQNDKEIIYPTSIDQDTTSSDDKIDLQQNLGDVRVNSISIFDADDKLKLKIGIDDENSGYLQVTNEVEDYFYPSGLDDIDLNNLDHITVKSLKIKDSENNEKVFLGLNENNDGLLSFYDNDEIIKYPNEEKSDDLSIENLGDITVNSIKVLNSTGIPVGLIGQDNLGNGRIDLRNSTGQETSFSSKNALQKGDNLGDINVSSLNVINPENEVMITLEEHKAGYGVIKAKNPAGNVVFASDDINIISEQDTSISESSISSDDIEVKSLTLVDDNGKKIGFFGKNNEGKPELTMYNTFQDISLSLKTSSNDGGKISLYDSMSNEFFVINDQTKSLFTDNLSSNNLTAKEFSSELVNSKELNVRSLEVGNIKTSKISVNNSNGDSKVLISVDDNDIGSIATYMPDNTIKFNSNEIETGSIGDNIEAKSLTILSENGDKRIFIGTNESNNGIFNIQNEFGIVTNSIKTDFDGNGNLELFNNTGQKIFALQRGTGDGGLLNIYNRNNENIAQIGVDQNGILGKISRINNLEIINQFDYVTSRLGNDLNGQGSLTISNQEGNPSTTLGTLSTGKGGGFIAYSSAGKITSFLGTNDNSGGILMSFNKHAKRTTYLGTNKSDYGMILLSSRGGVTRWGKEGNE